MGSRLRSSVFICRLPAGSASVFREEREDVRHRGLDDGPVGHAGILLVLVIQANLFHRSTHMRVFVSCAGVVSVEVIVPGNYFASRPPVSPSTW